VIVVSDIVQSKARALGPAGERWLHDLPRLVDEFAGAWDLDIGPALEGGTSSFVAETTMADGTTVVLKIGVPESDAAANRFRSELLPMLLGNGHGYGRVLRHDVGRYAMLLERLGPPLYEFGLPVAEQIDIICATLQEAWRMPPAGTELWTTADKGEWLARFIADTWERCGRPCAQATIDQALSFARTRVGAFDPATALVLHGDAHAHNTLHDPSGSTPQQMRFKFVDPDGLIGEPAYDLAIPMREFNEELRAGDAIALGLARCSRLHDLTGADERAIWEWGFIERVSTGLLFADLGHRDDADMFLVVADAWAGVTV
jgi:streptomycin 6-kinase